MKEGDCMSVCKFIASDFPLIEFAPCGVHSIDVKGWEIGVFKTLINIGFPDIELFLDCFAWGDNVRKSLFLLFAGAYQLSKKRKGWVDRIDVKEGMYPLDYNNV